MITVQILEAHDTIEPEDWCRPLHLATMSGGMSDDMSFKNCYTGTPENNVEWVQVKAILCDFWIGKPVSEFASDGRSRPHEFLRGEPPKSHRLNMKNYSDMSVCLPRSRP